ncbi:autoinducer binding domain-containing protein [Pseudomonas sp. UFMG81]|jgi:DNA-binding CsgD family transcriptional regulator|uniref:autoinducer binding domain-containing protein n=1 Tax=Pseudomonas sp. UFMG81 TaxID=2745936 RepID=UPI00188EEAA2|nr:autoinducer binding domain-containing protein [Pseudomonas sp. UFMG81]
MSQWTSEQLQQMLSERDPHALFRRAVDLVQLFEMDFLGMTLHLHLAGHDPQIILHSNYPRGWIEAYRDCNFVSIDPVITQCRKSTLPLLWHDDLYNEVPLLREAACAHGLKHGWTQSLYDMRHNECQLSVARPTTPVSNFELYEKGAQIMWLCQVLHAVFSEHYLTCNGSAPHLSKRELEVIKWSAEGKIAEDVAKILSLSTSTVNFHIRSVIQKTNTTNKVAAIVNVVRHGLL